MEISNKSTLYQFSTSVKGFFWQQYPHNSSFASECCGFPDRTIAVYGGESFPVHFSSRNVRFGC